MSFSEGTYRANNKVFSWCQILMRPICCCIDSMRSRSLGRDGGNKVTVTKFLRLLMILELYLELSYFLSQIFIVVTVTGGTEFPKFLIQK